MDVCARLPISGSRRLSYRGGNGACKSVPIALGPHRVGCQRPPAAVDCHRSRVRLPRADPQKDRAGRCRHLALASQDRPAASGLTLAGAGRLSGGQAAWHPGRPAPHTVTSDDGTTFDSGTVAVGGTFHFTFKTAGTFSYHCNIHPYMRSVIIVV